MQISMSTSASIGTWEIQPALIPLVLDQNLRIRFFRRPESHTGAFIKHTYIKAESQ